jgi:hypothetical protein
MSSSPKAAQQRHILPSTKDGYKIIAISFIFFALAGYATLFSAFLPLTGNIVRDSTGQRLDLKCLCRFWIR